MNIESKAFLSKRFKEYYWGNRVGAPLNVSGREFGFGTLEDKIRFRHRSFGSQEELNNYLRREAPFYVSYSTAYYEFPGNQPMEAKNWLGADLVFDLDKNMEYLNVEDLEAVKNEVLNLCDFLSNHFGFEKKDVHINFSGSKGYHVHVINDDVYGLDNSARREIADYVTAEGLDRNCFIRERESASGIIYDRGKPKIRSTVLEGPKKGDGGWAGIIHDGVVGYIRKSGKMDERKKEKIIHSIDRGVWEGTEGIREKTFDRIIEDYAVKLMGDTDRMVTQDVSRLIRLPDSLHGGTGLKAARAKNIQDFDPLRDAVAFGGRPAKLRVTRDAPKFELGGLTLGPYPAGSVGEVPECAAIYLILKGAAEVAV